MFISKRTIIDSSFSLHSHIRLTFIRFSSGDLIGRNTSVIIQ